jgi:geranylgeranyl transferase type-1 subunit beta
LLEGFHFLILSDVLDPYHTYLSLAAISICPSILNSSSATDLDLDISADPASWRFERLDALLNAGEATARWARAHIPAPES